MTRRTTWAMALLVAVLPSCGGNGADEVTGPTTSAAAGSTTTGPPATEPPATEPTKECRADAYRIRYPASWYVNDPERAAPCRFFHPEPFELPANTEVTGLAISVNVEPAPFAERVLGPEGSPANAVRAWTETRVADAPAVRAEITSTGEGLLPAGVQGVVYMVDFDGSTFVALASESAAAGTLAGNTEVLDGMMRTLERTDPPVAARCSADGMPADVPAQPGLPAAVAAIRAEIVQAAVACDFVGLAEIALRGDGRFVHSFGGGSDPAEAWRQDEAAGEPVLRTLVLLLGAPHAARPVDDGTQYAWPSAFAYERWQDVPPPDRDALRSIYDEDDFAGFEAFGAYVGYRAGITDGGDWVFFVAGD